MKGNGNSIGTLLRKLYFSLIPTSGGRSKYIRKHASLFKHVGKDVFFQPRKFPSDPELLSIGNNVKIGAATETAATIISLCVCPTKKVSARL